MKGDRRKISVPPVDPRKDRDEDFGLFLEMRRREKDRNINLLQPVSDEFEPISGNGNYSLIRIHSGKRGASIDFLADINSGKNDYDWLKTPPATPLFPSLEMEAAGPELAIHREIPILQPLRFSRFSGKLEEAPKDSKPATSTKASKPDSTAPTATLGISAKQSSTTKGIAEKMSKPSSNPSKTSASSSIASKPTIQKETSASKTDTNLMKQRANASDPKAKSRGVSPLVKSRLPATLPGFSDETPPNLRTTVSDRSTSNTRGRPASSDRSMSNTRGRPAVSDRSTSNTRGRPAASDRSSSTTRGSSAASDSSSSTTRGSSAASDRSSSTTRGRQAMSDRSSSNTRGRPAVSDRSSTAIRERPVNAVADAKQEIGKQRRQSCSPNAARGRKPDFGQEGKGKGVAGNGPQVLGSKMVEKLMNARKSVGAGEEKEQKPKYRVSGSERSTFGLMMSKSSLDMALKHMEIKRNPPTFHHYSSVRTRKSSATSSSSSMNSSPRATHEEDEVENPESLKQ